MSRQREEKLRKTMGRTYMPVELDRLLTRVCIYLGESRDNFVADAVAHTIEARLSAAAIALSLTHTPMECSYAKSS